MASDTIAKMAGNRSMAEKMANVVSQLDDEGKAQLEDLVADFESSRRALGHDKPKGQTTPEYHERNPWHGQEKKKNNFSLGEPFPRMGRDPEKEPKKANQRPVFSLGNPFPHTVRGMGRTDSKRPMGDVEQGLRRPSKEVDVEQDFRRPPKEADVGQGFRRPSREVETPAAVDSDETSSTLSLGEPTSTHQSKTMEANGIQSATRSRTNSKTNSDPARRTDSRNDQDQGTDMARKYKVDADTIGGKRDGEAVEEGRADPNAMRNWWARFRAKYPEPMAEFLCTTVSVFLGLCGTLSSNLSQNQSQQYGTFETQCWAWGLSFMFGIYLGGGVSGAHMNPSISITLSIFRGFPWRRCSIYIVIQILGAFTGAWLAYCIYRDAILEVDATLTATYSNWFTVPKPWVSPATAFFSEFLAGAVMMVAVLSLGDDQNNPPGAGMHAFIIGLLITVLKMTLGYNTGAALNPASDLGPRLIAKAVGYKSDDLFGSGWWAYGPWGGNLSGALVGCTLYDAIVFVGSESPINYRWSKEKHPWKVAADKML